MAFRSCTTIAAIMLKGAPALGLEMLADEILQSKIAERAGERSVSWDCDDLVFLDFDALRIALHDIPATQDTPGIICLGVGPVPNRSLPLHIDSASLAHGLVKRLTQIIEANAVLWHDNPKALNAATMDDFQDELDRMLGYLDLQLQGTVSPKAPVTETPPARKARSALSDQSCVDDLRAKLRKDGKVGSPISIPIHVSIYVLACTFFFMIPALGSALLSYIWLRDGVDKSSSRS